MLPTVKYEMISQFFNDKIMTDVITQYSKPNMKERLTAYCHVEELVNA